MTTKYKARAENGQDTNIKLTPNNQRQSREWTRHQFKGVQKIVKAIAQNGQYTNVKVTTKDKAIAENGQDTNIKVT